MRSYARIPDRSLIPCPTTGPRVRAASRKEPPSAPLLPAGDLLERPPVAWASKEAGPPERDDDATGDLAGHAINTTPLVVSMEHWTIEGKVYLGAVNDYASSRIVVFAIGVQITTGLALNTHALPTHNHTGTASPPGPSLLVTRAVNFLP